MNCVHGLDARFCSVCNRISKAQPRSALASVSLEEILRFLSHERIRATYGAVAEALGVIPRALGARLGERRPEASWIVNAASGLPADYTQDEWHPELLTRADIITSGSALALRMAKWRRSPEE